MDVVNLKNKRQARDLIHANTNQSKCMSAQGEEESALFSIPAGYSFHNVNYMLRDRNLPGIYVA